MSSFLFSPPFRTETGPSESLSSLLAPVLLPLHSTCILSPVPGFFKVTSALLGHFFPLLIAKEQLCRFEVSFLVAGGNVKMSLQTHLLTVRLMILILLTSPEKIRAAHTPVAVTTSSAHFCVSFWKQYKTEPYGVKPGKPVACFLRLHFLWPYFLRTAVTDVRNQGCRSLHSVSFL